MTKSLEIPTGVLRDAIADAMHAAARKATIPILSYILISATKGQVSVTATDMELHITRRTKGSGTLAPVTVSAHRLAGLLAKAKPDDTADISVAQDMMTLRCAGLTARLSTLPADEFPGFTIAGGEEITLPTGSLRELMTRPAHAISTEETRYYLNGIYLHTVQHDGRTMLAGCATDGHRLCLARVDPEDAATLTNTGIIPRATCGALAALLADLEGTVDLTLGENALMVEAEDWTLSSRIIDGTFPEYERVVPNPGEDAARLVIKVPADFAKAIATVAAITDETTRAVRISGRGDAVLLTVSAAWDGDAEIEVDEAAAIWSGKSAEFGANAKYLRDICTAFNAGCTMIVTDGATPIRIEGNQALGVLMPLRV